jgi:hypothetical protein
MFQFKSILTGCSPITWWEAFMSGRSEASSSKRRRASDRKNNEPDFIIPQSKWAFGHFDLFAQQLRGNNGTAVSYLRKFTEPFEHVETVTHVYSRRFIFRQVNL